MARARRHIDPQATFGYSQRVLTLTAASSSTVLAFDGRNDSYSWYLDNVTITDAPEPASLLLTGLGLAAVAAASKRLRRGNG